MASSVNATSSSEASGISPSELPDELDQTSINQLLEKADDIHCETLTSNNIRRAVAQFEKRIKKNQEDRIKYSDDPEKWLKSEVGLDEEVRKFTQMAAFPEIYPEFVKLGGVSMLVGLLNHANSDIAVDVMDVFSEITDPDTLREVTDPEEFIEELLNCQFPEMCVDTILRINEEENGEEAISNVLQVIENLSDIQPNICERFAKAQKFVVWLLRRIRQGTRIDYNRVYASEILGIILQNAPQYKDVLRHKGVDGVDKLLRSIAPYRKRNPTSIDEEELVQNIFDCLCSLMLVPAHQVTFGKAQGLELMIRMMKERKFACPLSIRLCNFALNNCAENCEIFVQKLGLKQLFPLLMYKGVVIKRGSESEKEHDEHSVGILQSICRWCSGVSVDRVLNKFTENRCEKLERLVELHEKYQSRVTAADRRKVLQDSESLDETVRVDDIAGLHDGAWTPILLRLC
eukprot:GHVQ01012987.1.p1 GENE.GHVQ01012987.1~~GHVQ01012987.1.p1  ORF type:complete len:460 (+),score=51.73 GHVQ01012987.1:487-1866(+)